MKQLILMTLLMVAMIQPARANAIVEEVKTQLDNSTYKTWEVQHDPKALSKAGYAPMPKHKSTGRYVASQVFRWGMLPVKVGCIGVTIVGVGAGITAGGALIGLKMVEYAIAGN